MSNPDKHGSVMQVPITYGDVIDPADTEGLPAVALHAWGGTRMDFEGVANDLAVSAGRRIITVGFPSDKKLSVVSRANVLQNLATRLELGPHSVIGHSMGGEDAVEYATRKQQLGVVHGIASVVGSHDIRDRYLTGIVAATTQVEFVNGRGLNKYVALLGQLAEGNEAILDYAHHIGAFTATERSAYHYAATDSVKRAKSKQGGRSRELGSFMAFSGVKTFIRGEYESVDYLPELEASDVEVITIPRANHFIHADNRPAYVAAIGSFMTKVDLHHNALRA